MEFDITRELRKLNALWDHMKYSCEKRKKEEEAVISLYGPKGCGKTKIAQEYVNSHAFAFYISFANLTERDALASFIRTYIPDEPEVSGWDEAVDAFMNARSYHSTMIIFDCDNRFDCYSRFLHYAMARNNVVICCISDHAEFTKNSLQIRHRSLSDFFKVFQNYSREDVLRLYALTGGLLDVSKELSADASYEDNVRALLKYDSPFSRHLPMLLSDCFRTPESYFPMLKSMADGHCRLSEIARDSGLANNKCLNYLEALIRNGFVLAEKPAGAKQSTYHITGSYTASWFRYVYGRTAQQIAFPDALLQYVREDIDDHIALPAFWSACMRLIQYDYHFHFYHSNPLRAPEAKKSVTVKLRDGHEVILDYCVKEKDGTSFFIFPHSLDMKYTKNVMEDIFKAIRTFVPVYDTHVTVFSIQRFSDWCVHESAVNERLHFATMNRMKY